MTQEAVIKTTPKKKKCKEAKQLPKEALQIAEKGTEPKGKGEKERYTYLNAEFQRIARRDKKAFLSDQCREIEENNRMGKTGSLQENQRYQRNISCKDGHNKGQKWYGLIRKKDINKRWQEYTEELYKKGLHGKDNHDGVITHTRLACCSLWSCKESDTTE